MKTLYLSDLDGTLLNSKERLSDFTIHAVNSLVNKGTVFSYATARSIATASKVTAGLNSEFPVITYNGAFIINNATHEIWSDMYEQLSKFDIDYVEYPHSITKTASRITDITEWVYYTFGNAHYDFLVGHSMGGIIALELAASFGLACRQIILIDSNLKPANPFYRNLMTPEHMKHHGSTIMRMMKNEAPYYQENLKKSLQDNFDYTGYVRRVDQDIYAIYGDRGQKGYTDRIRDLCLDESVSERIIFSFIEKACHMPMIENPSALANMIANIVQG